MLVNVCRMLVKVNVLLVQGQELTGSTTDLGQGKLDTPDLPLVAETIFTDGLQFGIAGNKMPRSVLSPYGDCESHVSQRHENEHAQTQWYSQTRGLERTTRDLNDG